MAKVVNIDNEPYDVYIGRPSKYGNKFIIGIDGNRLEVIEKYEKWLKEQPELINDIKQNLKGKVLGCHCSPKKCHGDIILRIANPEMFPIESEFEY